MLFLAVYRNLSVCVCVCVCVCACLQDILSLGELRLTSSSSLTICRKLSSIGRRVLSIESVATLQGLTTLSPIGLMVVFVIST